MIRVKRIPSVRMNGTRFDVKGRKLMIRLANGIAPLKMIDQSVGGSASPPYLLAVQIDDELDQIPIPLNTWIVTPFRRFIRLFYPFDQALDCPLEIVTADDLNDDIRPIARTEDYCYYYYFESAVPIAPLTQKILEAPFYYPISPIPYRTTSYRPIPSLFITCAGITSVHSFTAKVYSDDDVNNPISTFLPVDPQPWICSPRTNREFAPVQVTRNPIASYFRFYRIVIENLHSVNVIPFTNFAAWGKPV
jgi:hypothetical protein